MNDQRTNRKKHQILLVLYLIFCLGIVVFAYLHLCRIARDFNTQHMELITGLYAEKMNDTMETLQNYADEKVGTIHAMKDTDPEKILQYLNRTLDQTIFCSIGFILNDGEILGNSCAASDIKKKHLDQLSLSSESSFNSDPYQSSEVGNMIMTVFVPVEESPSIKRLYVSIMLEDLRQLGVYELLRGKIDVHLLKADSENFITCISSISDASGSWNNLLLQQKYYEYDSGYSYSQWIKDMQSGKKDGRFSAKIRGEECTISYQNISSMPGWYVIVELANRNITDITRHFSVWGGFYGSILVGLTILYMLIILLLEKKDKKHYMGLSATDTLTGLLNRRAFQKHLEEELDKKTPGIFIFIDVDNFKSYNDTYGHHNGDLCLIHFAKAMKQCFPQDTILGRYGGDEFVVYIKNTTKEKSQKYMTDFQKTISRLELSSGEFVSITASAGGAIFPDQGNDFLSLCRCADVALYDVKRNGKADYKIKDK